MSRERIYREFVYREAVFRIACERFDEVTTEIKRQRHILEAYIQRFPEFGTSLIPLEVGDDAPLVAQRMSAASLLVGVGPMAAVAGAMAQCAVEAGKQAGAAECIVENGGDIFLHIVEPIVVGLYGGEGTLAHKLGFSLEPSDTPIAICSSSSKMGHSMSLGQCDLATVVAKDAALADAAATHAANQVMELADVDGTLEKIAAIEGVAGIVIMQDDRIGLAGQLPSLVKTS